MAGATKLDQIYLQMQEQHQQVLTSLKPQRASKPQSISNVGSAEADSILLDLQFSQDDGNLASPIVVPAGEPSCSPFDYSQHPSEDAGTPVLLKHHEHHLGCLECNLAEAGFRCMMSTAGAMISNCLHRHQVGITMEVLMEL